MKAYTYETFHRCEDTTDWNAAECTLSLSSTEKVEGRYSIKMTAGAPIPPTSSGMDYSRTVNWSKFDDIIFSVYHPGWTVETGIIRLATDGANYSEWNFDFAASWTEITIDLSSTPDASAGTLDLSNITYIWVYEENLLDEGEFYYFDFFRGRSIDVSDYVETVRIRDGIFPIRKRASFMTHPDDEKYFTKTHTLKILDDSDVLAFLGVITDKNRGADGLYRYALDSLYNEAHDLNYAKDFSSDKSSEKIQDIIDNSFDHITRDSSITATTIDYDYSLNRPSAALINLIRFLERQVPYIEPNGLMRTKDHDGLTKTPQYFGATYNFRDEDVGTSGTAIDGIDGIGAGYTAEIIASYEGHKKILQVDRTGAFDDFPYDTVSSQASGTIELFIGASADVSQVRAYESTTTLINVGYKPSTNKVQIYHGDGAGGNTLVEVACTDPFPHVKITFDCATDTFSVWVKGSEEVTGENFYSDATATGATKIAFIASGGISGYFDAISYSWDANYNVGDNEVAWDVSSHHQSVQLIDAKEFRTGYYKGSLGITRASVRMNGNVIRTKPDDRADEEQAIGVHALKEYRDLKLVANTEADQLATNLFDVFSAETEFLSLRIEGEGFLQPGQTLEIQNTGAISIAKKDFLLISFVYDPKSDIYLEAIVSSNVVLPSEFTSNFDTSSLQIHQANLQTFENATDVATNVTAIATKGNCNIATGTYTGNGNNNRQITGFGFTPKSVIVSINAGFYYVNDSMTAWDAHYRTSTSFALEADAIKIISDGIEVNNNHASDRANINLAVYYYTALG